MPLRDTEAFVLRTYALKEADKICLFLTRDAGKLRGVAYGARKVKSRYGASLEPFTQVALTYFQHENRELVNVSDCEIIRSQFFAVTSGEMLAALHYLAELVSEFLPDHEPNERVYRLVAATLKGLENLPDGDPAPLVRYFEVWMLRLAGFLPDWRLCAECERRFAPDESIWLTMEGVPKCADCSHQLGDDVTPAVRAVFSRVLAQAPESFIAQPPDPRTLRRIETIATRLIRRALERDLKSYDLLNRLRPEAVGSGQ
ncbi:MAG: DNA repair protein RecO [Alphaproteobacteria bacterium]|nr:DNA repair protein RecO [Alphaproteobacteria bacterium]